MRRHITLIVISLTLGLAFVGGGMWLLMQFQPEIDIPESNPVIYEQQELIMGERSSSFYIYEDGSLIYIEEKGLRPSGGKPTRIWKTGNLTAEQLDNLLSYFENSGFEELDDNYVYSPETVSHAAGLTGSDIVKFIFAVDSENLTKTVVVSGYLAYSDTGTYPEMPYPLDNIYEMLRTIAGATQEVYREEIV